MIDDLDRKIILALQKNTHSRYATIAKILQISQSTVSRRINRLLKEEIVRIVALPDLGSLGYDASAFIALNVDIRKLDDICEQLKTHVNVYTVSVLFGRWDIVISVFFYSKDLLSEFIRKELSQIEGILKIETLYVVETKKLTFGWLPPRISPKGTRSQKPTKH